MSRGYLRKRKRGFFSGATFPEGCFPDPPCLPPYKAYRHQCLFFPDIQVPLGSGRRICKEVGGFLPYDFLGYFGEDSIGDLWHWLNFPPKDGECLACRPSRWSEGVTEVPCEVKRRIACERKRVFPLSVPRRPLLFRREEQLLWRLRGLLREQKWRATWRRYSYNPYIHLI